MQRLHPKNRPNYRQLKNEQNRRRENDLPVNDLPRANNQPIYPSPTRETRMGNVRRQNFNLKLDRNQASGMRRPIQFNATDWRRNRDWNRKHQLKTTNTPASTTTSTTTTTTTTTPSLPIANYWNPTTMPPQPDTNYWNPALTDDEIMLKRRDEEERIRYEKQQRRLSEEQAELRRLEEQRVEEEHRLRSKHLEEMQRRREQLELEEKQMIENQRIQAEKQRQNELRNLQNEQNRKRLEEEEKQRREQELIQHQSDQTQSSRNDNQQREANEIYDAPITEMSKRERQRRVHAKLKKLTPEQLAEYWRKRAEKGRKREIEKQKPT